MIKMCSKLQDLSPYGLDQHCPLQYHTGSNIASTCDFGVYSERKNLNYSSTV